MNSGLNNWNSLTKRVLLLFVTASYSGGHYICVLNTAHFSRASKKHQFSTKTTKTKTNSTFKSWKCCFYADFARGLYFNTRLNWKRAFRSKTTKFKSACTFDSKQSGGLFTHWVDYKAPAKKAPNFRCFFPLFTAIYSGFACFFHIDKITAHGFFRTPSFHFHIVFCSLCATQSTQSVWYIIKKASITIQIR